MEFGVYALGFRGLGVSGLGFRVHCLEFPVYSTLGFRVIKNLVYLGLCEEGRGALLVLLDLGVRVETLAATAYSYSIQRRKNQCQCKSPPHLGLWFKVSGSTQL